MEAQRGASIGRQGDIVLQDRYSDTLYKYETNGKCYTQKWAKTIPGEIHDSKFVCDICINSRGELFLKSRKDKNTPTICYNHNLQKKYSVNHKGELIDSTDGEIFYLEECGDYQYKIEVVRQADHCAGPTSRKAASHKEDLSQTLALLHQWKGFCAPSVCRGQQYYVVVEYWDRALDVFDLKGLFASFNQFC